MEFPSGPRRQRVRLCSDLPDRRAKGDRLHAGEGMTDEEEFSPGPIPFWPIDLVPEDDDRVIERALIEDRWARLDALAGRVG